MRFFLSFALILGFLALPQALFAEKKDKSSFFSKLFSLNKEKPSSPQKKPVSKKASKKVQKEVPDSLSKKRLPAESRRPKKSTEELTEELASQLSILKTVCDLEGDQKAVLREKLKNFQEFLRDNLNSDPYMVFEYKLEFGDLLDLTNIEEDSSLLSASDFDSSYKRFFRLPENLEPESYPHSWAKTLWETFKCAENPDKNQSS